MARTPKPQQRSQGASQPHGCTPDAEAAAPAIAVQRPGQAHGRDVQVEIGDRVLLAPKLLGAPAQAVGAQRRNRKPSSANGSPARGTTSKARPAPRSGCCRSSGSWRWRWLSRPACRGGRPRRCSKAGASATHGHAGRPQLEGRGRDAAGTQVVTVAMLQVGQTRASDAESAQLRLVGGGAEVHHQGAPVANDLDPRRPGSPQPCFRPRPGRSGSPGHHRGIMRPKRPRLRKVLVNEQARPHKAQTLVDLVCPSAKRPFRMLITPGASRNITVLHDGRATAEVPATTTPAVDVPDGVEHGRRLAVGQQHIDDAPCKPPVKKTPRAALTLAIKAWSRTTLFRSTHENLGPPAGPPARAPRRWSWSTTRLALAWVPLAVPKTTKRAPCRRPLAPGAARPSLSAFERAADGTA